MACFRIGWNYSWTSCVQCGGVVKKSHPSVYHTLANSNILGRTRTAVSSVAPFHYGAKAVQCTCTIQLNSLNKIYAFAINRAKER